MQFRISRVTVYYKLQLFELWSLYGDGCWWGNCCTFATTIFANTGLARAGLDGDSSAKNTSPICATLYMFKLLLSTNITAKPLY
jgi:hypothetical protein